MQVSFGNGLTLPLPPDRAARYRPLVGKEKLSLGLRPEHVTEMRQHLAPGIVPFSAQVDVSEPMGMETIVYFKINGSEVCGRVNPKAGARDGAPMQFAADLNNMHIIDDASGLVV